MKRLLFVLAGLAALNFSQAGTYEVTGVVFDSVAYAYGSLQASGNDVKYTMLYDPLQTSAIAPGSFNANPFVQSVFHWKVRWTGAPGETHPSSVLCRIETYGHARAHASIHPSNPYPGTYRAIATITDPFVTRNETFSTSNAYPGVGGTDGSLTDARQSDTFGGTGTGWTNISGNIWEGTVDSSINSGCYLEATFLPNIPMTGQSIAGVDMAITLRIVEIDSQTVAPDF